MRTHESLFEKLCRKDTLYASWKIVKSKKVVGGIDGVTLDNFDNNVEQYISELSNELVMKNWIPEPYLRIEIPKKNNEVRKLGLLSIKDKIVQNAIKVLIEPIIENVLVDNSYAYRPNKGHAKAVKRTLNECKKRSNKWLVRIDVDNFFDTINHQILEQQLYKLIPDKEIVRLIMLSVQMGIVNKRMKWSDCMQGIPQGAILSPLLSNLYLTSFDKYIQKLCSSYIRYADDFCLMCDDNESLQELYSKASTYLSENLKLELNAPEFIDLTKDPFEFLGITISKRGLALSKSKEKELKVLIDSMDISNGLFSVKTLTSWNSTKSYYEHLLPQDILHNIDDYLYNHIKNLIAKHFAEIKNRSVLTKMVSELEYMSYEFQLYKRKIIQDYIEVYNLQKNLTKELLNQKQNQQVLKQRKNEYQKREREGCELLVNTLGCYLGLSGKGITVKQNGKVIAQRTIGNLNHITIASKGVSISSNLIDYCLTNKISIDFFSLNGIHKGSILSPKYLENTLWHKQTLCDLPQRMCLASSLIYGKITNQLYLIKYFHKYHKLKNENLNVKYEDLILYYKTVKKQIKECSDMDSIVQLIGYESQMAIKYWAYIRELLKGDEIEFLKREHKGATDLVNCMLNYGYAILYSRVWQALLAAKLNPYDSIIHVKQTGKPTFVYDIVEIFRSQVVDRVVISLIQKRRKLKIENNLLDNETRCILAKNILERLNRYEKYHGEEVTMEGIIFRQAREIALWIDKDVHYKPYIAKW